MSKRKAKATDKRDDDYPPFPKPRPATNADRLWFERRLGQMRLPGFDDTPPAVKKGAQNDQ